MPRKIKVVRDFFEAIKESDEIRYILGKDEDDIDEKIQGYLSEIEKHGNEIGIEKAINQKISEFFIKNIRYHRIPDAIQIDKNIFSIFGVMKSKKVRRWIDKDIIDYYISYTNLAEKGTIRQLSYVFRFIKIAGKDKDENKKEIWLDIWENIFELMKEKMMQKQKNNGINKLKLGIKTTESIFKDFKFRIGEINNSGRIKKEIKKTGWKTILASGIFSLSFEYLDNEELKEFFDLFFESLDELIWGKERKENHERGEKGRNEIYKIQKSINPLYIDIKYMYDAFSISFRDEDDNIFEHSYAITPFFFLKYEKIPEGKDDIEYLADKIVKEMDERKESDIKVRTFRKRILSAYSESPNLKLKIMEHLVSQDFARIIMEDDEMRYILMQIPHSIGEEKILRIAESRGFLIPLYILISHNFEIPNIKLDVSKFSPDSLEENVKSMVEEMKGVDTRTEKYISYIDRMLNDFETFLRAVVPFFIVFKEAKRRSNETGKAPISELLDTRPEIMD